MPRPCLVGAWRYLAFEEHRAPIEERLEARAVQRRETMEEIGPHLIDGITRIACGAGGAGRS